MDTNHCPLTQPHAQRPSQPILGRTRDGYAVFDRSLSHLHIDKHLLAEAIARIHAPRQPFAKLAIPMGRRVGTSICVPTTHMDEIIFARRPNRAGLTRFALNRSPIPCETVILILKRSAPREFVLITAFIGDHSEPEPWDRNADAKAIEFWNTHALVFDPSTIIPGTETTLRPW